MSTQNKDSRGNLIFIGLMLLGAGRLVRRRQVLLARESRSPRSRRDESAQARRRLLQVRPPRRLRRVARTDKGRFLRRPALFSEGTEKREGKAARREGAGQEAAPPRSSRRSPTSWKQVVTLGSPGSHLTVKINPRGAGVGQVVLNHFQAADLKTGEPVWLDAEHKVKKPLELVPEDRNRDIASFLLYHYPDQKGEDYPLDTLGKRYWKRCAPAEVKDDEPVTEAAFETEVQGVRITKTYTLQPRDYHVGLEIKLELADPQGKERHLPLSAGRAARHARRRAVVCHVYRNTLIGQVEDNDSRAQVCRICARSASRGAATRWYAASGRSATPSSRTSSSPRASPSQTRDQKDTDFLGQARPLLLESALKGKLAIVPDDKDGGEVEMRDAAGTKHVFWYSPGNVHYATEETKDDDRKRVASALVAGAEVIVVHRSVIDRTGKSREFITDVLDPNQTAADLPRRRHRGGQHAEGRSDHPAEAGRAADRPQVRAVQRPGEGAAAQPPQARRGGRRPARRLPAVDPAEVTYYLDDLHLDTLTDYPTELDRRRRSAPSA